MKKYFHSAEMSIFSNNKENQPIDAETIIETDREEIIKYICEKTNITQEEFEKKGIKTIIETIEPEDEFTKPMYIAKINITKKPELIINTFLSKENIKIIKETIESRIDEEGYCYMRFDKDAFINKKEIKIVDHGNCIHLKAKIAAFPQKKENAIKVFEEYLQSQTNKE